MGGRWSPLIGDCGSEPGSTSLATVCASSIAVPSACRGCCTTSNAAWASAPAARLSGEAGRRWTAAKAVRGRSAVGQRQHHARERDAVGDAVVHPHEHRGAGAEAVDEVHLPQRARAVERRGDAVGDEGLERRRSPGAGSATWWKCSSRSSSASSQCGPVRPSTGRWRKRSNRSTSRSRTTSCSAAQSTGSSNHSTLLMTIRLVGRSMCSQAASALVMAWEVLMHDASRAAARIRDKYGRAPRRCGCRGVADGD